MKKLFGILLIIGMLMSFVACDLGGIGNVGTPDGGNTDNGITNDSNGSDNGDNAPDNGGESTDNNGNNTNNNGGADNSQDNNSGNNGSNDNDNPTPTPDPENGAVYLLNRANWDQVAIYYWNGQGEIEGGWPGYAVNIDSDGLYKVVIPSDYTQLIFNNNNNGAQTADLTIPTDDRVVYDNLDNVWLTYSEAIAILNAGSGDGNNGDDPDDGNGNGGDNGGNDGGDNGGNTGGNDGTGNEQPNPDYPEDELALFYALFDPENHVSFDLDISSSELKKIQQDYEKYSSRGSKSPIYRMADLTITITKPDGSQITQTIEQVGVRMKGNTSRTSFYNDHDGMYNLVHFKISFQETFDEAEYYGSDALTWTDSAARKERKNRTFATLEKIDIRWNRNFDSTCIRESYAYDLYREFGVLAPHTNLASVDIGNDHAGVWVIYEPIDKIFLEKNLPESALGGDLYKLGWTSEGATFTSFSSYGVEDEDAGKFFVYDLKTNKKTSTHESLRNLINTIKSSSVTKEQFASVVDIENFMYYCAVSYIVGNCDDLRYNYNNSYIYFRPDTGKMIVIPYDMDRGLGVNRWNPSGHGMTKEDPFTKWTSNGDQRSPLFLKSVCNGGFFKNEYIEALKDVDASEMLTNARFVERFNVAKNLYSSDVVPSKSYNNAGQSGFYFDVNKTCSPNESRNMSFADYMSAKRATLYSYIGDQDNTDTSGGNTGGNTGDNTGGNSGDNTGGNTGGDDSSDPITNSKPYIMGDMNGWQVNSQYAMISNSDGTFTFTVTEAHVSSTYGRIKLKLFDDSNGVWYGYEIVDPDCTVNYNDITDNSNENKNIYLAPGTYLLTFDANTTTLYIEKQ